MNRKATLLLANESNEYDHIELDDSPLQSAHSKPLRCPLPEGGLPQFLNVTPQGAHLASRTVEYVNGQQRIVVSDKYFDMRGQRPERVVFTAQEEQPSTDKLTVFALGFAASAILVVAVLLFLAVFLH